MAPLTVQGGSDCGEPSNPSLVAGEGSSENSLALTILNAGQPSNPPLIAGDGSSENRLALTILNAGGPGGPPSPPRRMVMPRPPKNRLFPCNYCYQKLSSSQALGGHQNAHRHERKLEKQRKALENAVPVAGPLFPYPGSVLSGGQFPTPLYGSSLGTPSALGTRYGSLVRKPRASYLYSSTLSSHPLRASKNASTTTTYVLPPSSIDKPMAVAPLQAYNNADPGLALVPSAASDKHKTSAPNKVLDLKLIPPYNDVCPETGIDLTLKL